jgi:DNA-binding MarR family transcriptional regulator
VRTGVVAARNDHATPKRLAEHLQLSTGATTNLLDRMEEASLVSRVPNPADRRSSVLELADKGTEVARSVSALYQELFREAVEPQHLAILTQALNAISERIGAVSAREGATRVH